MSDHVESFSAMLRGALGPRIDPAAETFAAMFADDGVMEFPYALPGGTERVEGRSALVGYLAEVSRAIAFDHVGAVTVHDLVDPATVVLEFEGFGRGTATGEPYRQRYVSIIRIRDGRIVHYKDYWNPLAVIRATRGSQAVATLVEGEAHYG